jgi:hypothetical protein
MVAAQQGIGPGRRGWQSCSNRVSVRIHELMILRVKSQDSTSLKSEVVVPIIER